MNPLREHVDNCSHPACVATRKLEENGANLILGKGRHCEIAVLAAAGDEGLSDEEIVRERRAYADHLSVTLDGRTDATIADAPHAVHARHAAEGNINDEEDAKSPIRLGSARVTRTASPERESLDRYRLVW